MIVNAGYRGKVGAAVPKFTYTGQYNQRDDGVVELLTSGTLVFLSKAVIDLFLVGGGGGGGSSVGSGTNSRYHGCGGGGGGYTKTIKNKEVYGTINVSIGAGGTPGNSGGTTTFGNEVALGGAGGANINASSSGYGSNGGSGGSGGGAGLPTQAAGTWSIAGGSDGSNGSMPKGTGLSVSPGTGQGTTTREFGEIAGKLYAGGGGGGYGSSSTAPGQNANTSGGNGGGGNGTVIQTKTIIQPSTAGKANTGGGGGGGGRGLPNVSNQFGASGGSGIVCFRPAK